MTMRIFLFFGLFNVLIISPLQSSTLFKGHPPGCDTLITTEGTVYFIHIRSQSKREVQYLRCDEASGRVYAIRRKNIAAIKPWAGAMLAEESTQPSLEMPGSSTKYPLRKDTFDVLTLKDGRKLHVVILERDYYNTYYHLYDQPLDDRQYCVSNNQVRKLDIARSHRQRPNKQGSRLVALIILGILVLVLL